MRQILEYFYDRDIFRDLKKYKERISFHIIPYHDYFIRKTGCKNASNNDHGCDRRLDDDAERLRRSLAVVVVSVQQDSDTRAGRWDFP